MNETCSISNEANFSCLGIWGLCIIMRPSFDPKTVFIKLFYIKAKEKYILVLSIRSEVYQAQIGCKQSIQC